MRKYAWLCKTRAWLTLAHRHERFLPIPAEVSDREAAAVILNYGTAWQMIHRIAKVEAGQTALVTGAGGGVGTAALQLLRLAGVKTYGAASTAKHDTVRSLGATPIDYRGGPFDRLLRSLEPEGVDYVFDSVGGAKIGLCIGALRRGGTLVGFGFMGAHGMISQLATFANIFIGARAREQDRQILRRPQSCIGKIPSRCARIFPRSSHSSRRRRSMPWSAIRSRFRGQTGPRTSGHRFRGRQDRAYEWLKRRGGPLTHEM